MFGLILKGGFMVYPLFLLSIVALMIFVERWMFLNEAQKNTDEFIPTIKEMYSNEGVKAAYRYCNLNPSVISNIFKSGLRNSGRNYLELQEALESTGNVEIKKIEANLNILGTIAGVAPLMGFLGTVTGMIKAFMQIQQLGGGVDASVLAGGIWEALISTAVGLSVAIPIYIAYQFLSSKIDKLVLFMEESSLDLINLLAKGNLSEITEK
jgi:biopolymer transport protein ExbB